ncbi:MAG: hypothetical protein BRC26_03955 [Nanohaloarchaea archaeon QH_8_44_6]|nr:MAG: hypothetical protein BRC26_03955 [Nanohaloarchaea archaeon QH_8_44_6]
MRELEFSELPEGLRVKLSEDREKELWHRIDEFGGIKEFTQHFDYSQSKMYNWRNKDSFLPVKFVRRLMGGNNSEGIKALKGKGSGKVLEDPEFPLRISDELLTRVKASVSVNSEGIPTYMTDERSLADRFMKLLNELGEVPSSLYSRQGRFQVRYPKFLQQLFEGLEFKEDFAALVDEEGVIEDGNLEASGKEVSVEDFSGKLYSREKKFELALQKGDDEAIKDIIGSEASKVDSLLRN